MIALLARARRYVPYPDAEEREAALAVHTRHMPLAPGLQLATVAQDTERFSCAALASLCQEALRQALARQQRAWLLRHGMRAGRGRLQGTAAEQGLAAEAAREEGGADEDDDVEESEEEAEGAEEEEEEMMGEEWDNAARPRAVITAEQVEGARIRARDFRMAALIMSPHVLPPEEHNTALEMFHVFALQQGR